MKLFYVLISLSFAMLIVTSVIYAQSESVYKLYPTLPFWI